MNLKQSIETAVPRFWSNVAVREHTECWHWKAGRTSKKAKFQYGSFTYAGRTVKAHRCAYMFWNGVDNLPSDQYVLHKCDNPICVNPLHLFVGTHADNMRDMVSKGRERGAVGTKNGGAKLTEQQVKEIRASSEIYKVISEKYGISDSMISNIKLGRSWTHVK